MNGLPMFPALGVEFLGSALAIILSFWALWTSRQLVRLQPENFIWGFLFYFSVALAVFSLSRGVGHIIRILLVYSGHQSIWRELAPLSGGLNTLLIISVAAVTIYYHKGLEAYRAIRAKAEKLAISSNQLQELNSHLEEMVEERTRNLSESEKKFRNFFENSKDIIYFCDTNGMVTNINSSGIQLLGLSDGFTGINFHNLFSDPDALSRYLDELEQNGFVSDLEMECRGLDGQTRNILLTASVIHDPAGKVIGCEGIGKDMTRIRTMTNQLINHEKMASVGQIAAGVAHEINTPLGIILGYTQLMLDDFEATSEQYKNLSVIERQTQACKRIVADLLKFSRQESSEKSEINPNTIIEEVLSLSEHTLNINGIEVIRKLDPQLHQIKADAEKLRQVFMNLFNNSQDAMADGGGVLTVTSRNCEVGVEIVVSDTGTGIPEEIQNRIFDPFFTTKEVGKGTGLGLSVTYGIIQDHGGSIESANRHAPDTGEIIGGQFTIHLPICHNGADSTDTSSPSTTM